jgi:hypothetical protein
MSMTRVHPDDGVLRALLDRELAVHTSIRVRLHVRSCTECGARLRELRSEGDAVAALIRSAAPEIDTDEAWARFLVRSGRAAGGQGGEGRSGEGSVRHRHPAWLALSATIAIATAVAVFALLTPESGPPDSGELLAMVSAARARSDEVVRDACCQDHDGGEFPDDGLLTLSLPGERVAVVIIYEDVDDSGTFTPGDIVRYVSRESMH